MPSRILSKQDDWIIILLFWGLSFEVGWQIPPLGLVVASVCGLLSLLEILLAGWAWLMCEEEKTHQAFCSVVSIILAGWFSVWLIPGLTIGYWLPLLGSVFQRTIC